MKKKKHTPTTHKQIPSLHQPPIIIPPPTTIQIIPQQISFNNVTSNTKYSIQIIIKNPTTQTYKIRIIPPISSYFTFQLINNPLTIVPGLNYKFIIYFYAENQSFLKQELFQDSISVIGNHFLKFVKIVAKKINEEILVPKFFKLGIVRLGKQSHYSIPIKNPTKQDVFLSQIKTSSPQITLSQNTLHIKNHTSTTLQIKLKISTPGLIQQQIFIQNLYHIYLKGICIQQNIDVFNKYGGSIMNGIMLGNVFIGDKVGYCFFIANNSSNDIQGIMKVFSKNYAEFNNLKVDEQKMMFINKTNPKKTVQQQRNIYFKTTKTKFKIDKYSDNENNLQMIKKPTKQQIQQFTKNLFITNQSNQHYLLSYQPQIQQIQILYIKLINRQQPIKICIHFNPIIPNIKINSNKFQFPTTSSKNISKLILSINNLNSNKIYFTSSYTPQFYLQGNLELQPLSEKQFYLCFKPLIIGQYSSQITLLLFDTWQIILKVYGRCSSQKSLSKQNKYKNLNRSLTQHSTRLSLTNKNQKNNPPQFIPFMKNKRREFTDINFYKNRHYQTPSTQSHPKLPPSLTTTQYPKTIPKIPKIQKLTSITHYPISSNPLSKSCQQLQLQQLQQIIIQNQQINFGHIVIQSFNQQQLLITNNNNKIVFVQIDIFKHACLSQTSTSVQKLQPFSSSKFIIKLKPTSLGHQILPICYIINKKHIFEMNVIANVTLLNLTFSTKHLKFQFPPQQLTFQKTQTLLITNNSPTTTKFHISSPTTKSFTLLSNTQQQLKPNTSYQLKIKYQPISLNQSGQKRIDVDQIIIKIVNGIQNFIICQGYIFEPKYFVKQTSIQYHSIFISTPHQHQLTLRNQTKHDTPTSISFHPQSLKQIISINQQLFMLHSNQLKSLKLTILSHQITTVTGYLLIQPRAGKQSKIPISITISFPTIQVLGYNEINLGIVHIMTNHFYKNITLVNKTNTQIKLSTRNISQENHQYSIDILPIDQRVQLALLTTQKKQQLQQQHNQLINKQQYIYIEQKYLSTNKLNNNNNKNICKIFTLQPHIQTQFKIKFIPKYPKQYSITIPLYLHKAIKDIQPILQKITCKAIQPLFFINPYRLIFQNAIISNNPSLHHHYLQITNPHNYEIHWQILQDTSPTNQLFELDIKSGNLQPNSIKKLNVYFKPQQQGTFIHKVKFYSHQSPQFHVQLQLIGTAVYPKIHFNKNTLIFPSIPLKTQIKQLLQIQNHGYQNIKITNYKFLQSYPSVIIKCSFINGKQLSFTNQSIHIQISFISNIPVSLTTILQIHHQFGGKISIPISFTADNCVMTIYRYLQNRQSCVIFDANDNTYKQIDNKVINVGNVSNRNLTNSNNFIKKWCNYQLNINIQNYPQSLIESRGVLLYELIIKMTNGRPIIKKPMFSSKQKIDNMLQLHSYYSDLISVLKSQGAFLNNIRPQYLLNINDYLLYLVQFNLLIDKAQFPLQSNESWIILFYQLYKLYIYPQITKKYLQNLTQQYHNLKFITSNLYSQLQMLLLKYFNLFYLQPKQLSCFNDRFTIYQIIQNVLYRGFKVNLYQQQKLCNINQDYGNEEYFKNMSKILVNTLQQYGLQTFLQPYDLSLMSHKQYILYFITLIKLLHPQKISSQIKFETIIGQKNIKTIQIINPSKYKKLKYSIKLSGSSNFFINQKQCILQPLAKQCFQLRYLCQQYSNQQALLLFIPVKDQFDFINAHPLQFTLKNTIISKTILKKLSIKIPLYDLKTIPLDIQLPQKQQHSQYNIKIIYLNDKPQDLEYPPCYLLQPGPKTLKYGKDKCLIKTAALKLGNFLFTIVYISSTLQQYIYQITANITLPTISQTFKLQQFTLDQQQIKSIIIPQQNFLKQQCLKYHQQYHKQKYQKQQYQNNNKNYKIKVKDQYNIINYQISFIQSSIFVLKDHFVKFCRKSKWIENNYKVYLSANFNKPYRQYKSTLLVKNQKICDYRLYMISAPVTIKPKIYQLTLQCKARQQAKMLITPKTTPFTFRLHPHLPTFNITQQDNNQLILTYTPSWLIQQQLQLTLQNPQTFQQHIYKIKLLALKPDPVKQLTIVASNIFQTYFQFDLSGLKISEKQLQCCTLSTDILRKHQAHICVTDQYKKIQGILHPGTQQKSSSIKLHLPKSQHYYQYLLSIKNTKITQLPPLTISQQIGQIKKTIIKQLNPLSKDFYCNIDNTYNYFYSEITTHYLIVFKPIKQIHQQQIIKFKSNGIQYILNILFIANKLDLITIPTIITQNIQIKSTFIHIQNISDHLGIYELYLDDKQKFIIYNSVIQVKSKDKTSVKVTYIPKYIGDYAKTTLILKSKTLPQLSYIIQGISKFKFQQYTQQIQGFEGTQISKQLTFKNEYPEHQKYKFEIYPNNSNFTFLNNQTKFMKQLQTNQIIKIVIKNKCGILNKQQNKNDKLIITKISTKKPIKQLSLKLIIIHNLQNYKYNWQCKTRQTIYQTIKLPPHFLLKSIQTHPQLQKFITYNIDSKCENQTKIKFSPFKCIKDKTFNLLLISEQLKYRIQCHVKVSPSPIDDTIIIRTSQVQQTSISTFKLTNTVKQPTKFTTSFQKNTQQLTVQPSHGILQPYGKQGTSITVKFKTNVNNRRVQDKLIVQTDNMEWMFKVIGIQEKLETF